MRHNLKLDEQWFSAVRDGRKRAEIRRADRPFKVGDELLLYQRDRSRAVIAQITDILELSDVPGCDCSGFVSLSIDLRGDIDGPDAVERELRSGSFS